MPQDKPFSLKIKERLYKWGFTKYGPELLRNYQRGSEDWFTMVDELLETKDIEGRKLALQQITAKGFFEKFPQRDRLTGVLLDYLKKGIGEEKRTILKFVLNNTQFFSKDDDSLTGQLFALQRDRDMAIANASEQILLKLGFKQ
jgi:hypothetical protein